MPEERRESACRVCPLGLAPPTMEQPQYNRFHRDKVECEFAPLYDAVERGTIIWAPFASELLTGKYNDGDPGNTRISMPDCAQLREQFENKVVRQLPGQGRSGRSWPAISFLLCRICYCRGA